MPYYVYILFSKSIQKHYIGQTNSIENRLKKHNSGTEKFTKKGMPWTLKHPVTVDSRSFIASKLSMK